MVLVVLAGVIPMEVKASIKLVLLIRGGGCVERESW